MRPTLFVIQGQQTELPTPNPSRLSKTTLRSVNSKDSYNTMHTSSYGEVWIPKPGPWINRPPKYPNGPTPRDRIAYSKGELKSQEQELCNFLDTYQPHSLSDMIPKHIRSTTIYRDSQFDKMLEKQFWVGLAHFFPTEVEAALDQQLFLFGFQNLLDQFAELPNSYATIFGVDLYEIELFSEEASAIDRKIEILIENLNSKIQ